MKIWVVGSLGLLGSALTQFLQKDFVATSRLECDITNLEAIETFLNKHPEITHIVNASAYSMVDKAQLEKSQAFLVNAMGPYYLAIAAKKRNLRFLHVSTDYVFKGDGNVALCEEDLTDPVNYYGMTKLEGEKKVLETFPDAVILRVSALFGSKGRNFVAQLQNLLLEKKELFLASDQYNRPTYVQDLCFVIEKLLDEKGLYHFANQKMACKLDIAQYMTDLLLQKGILRQAPILHAVKSSYFPLCCPRPAFSVFNTDKISKKLNIAIRPWQEAMAEYILKEI